MIKRITSRSLARHFANVLRGQGIRRDLINFQTLRLEGLPSGEAEESLLNLEHHRCRWFAYHLWLIRFVFSQWKKRNIRSWNLTWYFWPLDFFFFFYNNRAISNRVLVNFPCNLAIFFVHVQFWEVSNFVLKLDKQIYI